MKAANNRLPRTAEESSSRDKFAKSEIRMHALMQEEFGGFVTFRLLGGPTVSFDDLASEVGRLPLDGVLGFLGILSLEAVKSGQAFFHPTAQGEYLNLAIVDDFPKTLPAAPQMYAPGRLPITGGKYVFIHEQNIAFLSHIALLFSQVTCSPSPVGYELMRRISRLLLIVNDLLDCEDRAVPKTLIERRNFGIRWIRNGQFNRFYSPLPETMLKLARQRILMVNILPKYLPDLLTLFVQATNGVSLQKYFEILALFLSHVHNEMGPDKHWIRKDTFGAALEAGKDELELIFKRWIITPNQYRDAYKGWTGPLPASSGYLPGFDFVPLRSTPLIEGRPGELICPALPFLLAKIEDDAYFILSEYLREPGRFQSALGNAYHEYANSLLARVSSVDIKGSWKLEHPRGKFEAELADSYMQRGEIAFSFEHKGQRPGTEFLKGGQGDRVLGPSDAVLARLERGESVTLSDAHETDNGYLTRGMWQQCIAGPTLLEWAERNMGNRPSKIWPVITYLYDFEVDKVVRLCYLLPLIEKALLYRGDFWEKPQWLQIGDLEALASLAEQGLLDLAALFEEKNIRFANQRFDYFLFNRYGPKVIDKELVGEAETLLRLTGLDFWKEDLSQKDHG